MATLIEVWAENAQAFHLFRSLGTQWRVGMSGPTGIDFTVAYHRMDRMGLTPEEYNLLDDDLQIMESAALSVMHSKN